MSNQSEVDKVEKEMRELWGDGPSKQATADAPGQAIPEVEASEILGNSAAAPSNREVLIFCATAIHQALALKLGPHWKLEDGQAELLADAIDPVMQKYFPGLSVGMEATALLTIAAIYTPMYQKHIELKNPVSEASGND